MSMKQSALVLFFVLASACGQRADRPDQPAENLRQPPISKSAKALPASIMRPEVVEETAALAPSPEPEELRAVIVFERGAKLDEADRAALDKLISRPVFAVGGAITLSGHSDASGSDADNLVTSRRRAEAVRDFLQSKGIEAERISIIALGERRPVAPNAQPDGSDDPQGQQRNRRVEIVVAPPAQPQKAASSAVTETPATPKESRFNSGESRRRANLGADHHLIVRSQRS